MAANDGKINFHALRHRWEMPLIWLSVLVTLLSLGLSLAVVFTDEAVLRARFGDLAADLLDYAQTALLLLVLPLFIFLMRFYTIAKAKSNAIRVGPKQMPQIWVMYQSLCQRLQMPRVPRLYVINGNGVVNAYAMSCNTRLGYVVIHSEIAMLIETCPEAVEFVLAHELGHHKLGHVSLWRIVVGFIPGLLPPLGISTTRAQEYSADRVALKVCNHQGDAMKLLAVGPWMHRAVDDSGWLEQCEDERREVFVRLANVMSDHAVMVKRYKALRDIEAKGYSSQGDMF